MNIQDFYWNQKRIGYFRITGYIEEGDLYYIYNVDTKEALKVSAIQQGRMIKKILRGNLDFKNLSLIVQIRHIHKYASVDDIYRIEILDKDGKIVDTINTHKDGVPKDIREGFNKQFRNEDGSDRIIPLEILGEETTIDTKKKTNHLLFLLFNP